MVDRGGKGTLIGGANEFQEYAWGYYGIKSPLYTNDVTKVTNHNYINIGKTFITKPVESKRKYFTFSKLSQLSAYIIILVAYMAINC